MNTQRVEGYTPTPWDYRAGAGNCDPSITADGKTIAEMRGDATGSAVDHQAYANARFLVHACNNIERLEKVNESLVRALKEIASCPEEDINEQTVHIMLSIARSALAKEPA